jgi:hypothetical protein
MIDYWRKVKPLDDIQKHTIELQRIFGITFPKDYLECIKDNNRGYPHPKVFYVGNNSEVFNNLLNCELDDTYGILAEYNAIKDRLPEKVIPFARDPFGNLICFNYRESSEPTIVFWEHETASRSKEAAIKKVCNTFTELLNMLDELEEDEEY